ncbi:unnamed protein product [Leptosia nina]|uniref:Odorant receptor n=1 Tax=Leptosia nina TaxID=320188 RepID=A0AAV1K276_9NEOP
MRFVINNTYLSLRMSLTWLRLMGLWSPDLVRGWKKILYGCHTMFIYMFVVGTFIVIQAVDLYTIWGDIQLMTASAFVLFTNLTHSTKILNLVVRADRIKDIVRNNDRVLRLQDTVKSKNVVKSSVSESNFYFLVYGLVTLFTILLWLFAAALEAQDKQLPMRAWYPFNTTKSPLYELAYTHQAVALFLSASMNASKDILVTTLIAQCRCRLQLISTALKSLCQDMHIENNRLTQGQGDIVNLRLKECVQEHQNTLATVSELQNCFSEPTFAQFTVSLVIICVTAFQLVFKQAKGSNPLTWSSRRSLQLLDSVERCTALMLIRQRRLNEVKDTRVQYGSSFATDWQTGKPVRMLSMTFYLLNMVGQVYIYCREGNELSLESEKVSSSAYEFPWYQCPLPVRRSALIMMTRCRRTAKLTAAGFTTLSLASFMGICKASYSFFTVLKQMDEEK